jgi:hypothetical protein
MNKTYFKDGKGKMFSGNLPDVKLTLLPLIHLLSGSHQLFSIGMRKNVVRFISAHPA